MDRVLKYLIGWRDYYQGLIDDYEAKRDRMQELIDELKAAGK